MTAIDDLRELLVAADAVAASPAVKLASRFRALAALRLAAVRGATWGEFSDIVWTGTAIRPLRPLWRVSPARMKMAASKGRRQPGIRSRYRARQ